MLFPVLDSLHLLPLHAPNVRRIDELRQLYPAGQVRMKMVMISLINIRVTTYDIRHTIYDIRYTIYDIRSGFSDIYDKKI